MTQLAEPQAEAVNRFGISLMEKILQIKSVLQPIAKSARNDFHKYDYVTNEDVITHMNKVLTTARIMHYTHVVSYDVQPLNTTIEIELVLNCLDSGEVITARYIGFDSDKAGKHAYKAMTGAEKYAYMKFFSIPTGDDPERETQPQQQGRGNQQADPQRQYQQQYQGGGYQ